MSTTGSDDKKTPARTNGQLPEANHAPATTPAEPRPASSSTQVGDMATASKTTISAESNKVDDAPATPPTTNGSAPGNVEPLKEKARELLKTLLPFTNLTATEQDAVVQQLQKTDMSTSHRDLRDMLVRAAINSGIAGEKRANLDLVLFLDKIAGSSSRILLEAIHNDPKVTSIEQFAEHIKAGYLRRLLGDDKSDLAESIRSEVFRDDTASVVKGMLARGEILSNVPAEVRTEIGTTLTLNNFATTRSNRLSTAATQLKVSDIPTRSVLPNRHTFSLLRGLNLAQNPDSLRVLVNGNLSAASIASSNEDNFVSAYADLMGGSHIATAVHNAASQVNTRTTMAVENLRSFVNGTQPALAGSGAIDPVGERNRRILQVQKRLRDRGINLSLEDLFGPTEQSVIDESQVSTVYSPSAYFVDLLMYLRDNNLAKDKISQPEAGEEDSFKQTALEQLLRRRPDLIHLELTPQNANTVLPYVDLANEVMESFIAHTEQAIGIEAYNVDDEDTDYLLSQPQNVKIEAYRKLAAAVYPTSLPYHQPLDAQREFLQNLGVSKLELVTKFRPKALELDDSVKAVFDRKQMHVLRSSTPDVVVSRKDLDAAIDRDLVKYQTEALNNQQYCETLGICQEEYLIWTKSVFWPPEHFLLTEGLSSLTTQQYHQRIGLRPLWHYWGYNGDTPDEMLSSHSAGVSFVKEQLLPRAGISYTDLLEALQTRFVNPFYPVVRDKVILDSFRASYRYLQTLVGTPGPGMYDRVADFLSKENRTMSLLFKLTRAVGSNQKNVDNIIEEQKQLNLSSSKIREWVLSHFQSIGKILVLESGQGPKLKSTGSLRASTDETSAGKDILESRYQAEIIDGKLMYQNKRYKSAVVANVLDTGIVQKANDHPLGSVEEDGTIVFAKSGLNLQKAFPNLKFSLEDSPKDTGGSYIWTIRNGQLVEMTQLTNGGEMKPSTQSSPWTLTAGLGGVNNLEDVRLLHLDGTPLQLEEWDRLHRFLRIRRRMGWSARDTDRAIYRFSATKPFNDDGDHAHDRQSKNLNGHDHSSERLIKFYDFTDDPSRTDDAEQLRPIEQSSGPVEITGCTVKQLAATVEILKISSLRIEDLLTFWEAMPSSKPSPQYEKLFLRRSIRGTSKVFEADANGNYLITETKISSHQLAVVAALGMKLTDLEYLLSDDAQRLQVVDELNMSNLTFILRCHLLAKTLGVKITDLLQIITAFGDPFHDAVSCLSFFQKWKTLLKVPFSWAELRYVVETVSSPHDPMALTHVESMRMSKQLRDNVLKIQKDFPVKPPIGETVEVYAKRVLSMLLDPITVNHIMDLLQGHNIYSASLGQLSLDDEFLNKIIAETVNRHVEYVKSKVVTGNDILRVTGILDEQQIKRLEDSIDLYIGQKQIKDGKKIKGTKKVKRSWSLAIKE